MAYLPCDECHLLQRDTPFGPIGRQVPEVCLAQIDVHRCKKSFSQKEIIFSY
jgi:hypothetical protein